MNKLPHNDESEKLVIGKLLLEPSLIGSLKDELSPDRFYNVVHRKIYTTMVELYLADLEITPISVCEKLKDQSAPLSYIMSLFTGASPFLGINLEVARIISLARKRWFVQFSAQLDDMARNGKTEHEILDFASVQIDLARTKLPETRKRARLLESMIDDQAARYHLWHKGVPNALPTGFSQIDDHLLGGGLVRSGLYILAARPSMGKTSLGLDIASNIAERQKIVYILSREMPNESLFDRLHSAFSGVARWKLRPGIYKEEYERLITTLPEITKQKIILDDGSRNVADVKASLREFARREIKADILITDYLQLLESHGRTRNEEVGANSRALKGLAMEFGIPILALSQVSRESAKQHREPELEDLRDSGEIEQDADAVFFLFGEKPEEGAKFYARNFKCSKQRDGALFRTELTFNANLVTFRQKDFI